ncbi:hypothetical protein ACFUJU_28760 [Streptomyces sp. NPDC057235]|uniref:hypothetical protein n=1 Tax=Streptomyces sp. NPDC057235 TaxID=3346058 RepID=UPI00363F48D1
MALDPLATVADLTVRGLIVELSEEPFVASALDAASTAIREPAGSPISQTTSTVALEGEAGQWLSLPGQPVTAVTTVLLDGTPVTDWRLVAGRLWRAGGWGGGSGPSVVEVTQTHGLATVPADIVDLACRMVTAALVAYRSQPDGEGLVAKNVTQERIGDYSVSYGSDGRVTDMDLPPYWRDRLEARFGGGAQLLRSR